MLVRHGYKVKVLNTINFSKSMHYNPFHYIHSEKDILKLVNTIMVNTKGEGEKSSEDFWTKAERLLYCALIGYIWYEAPEEEQNFATLLEFINASETREDDETFKNAVDMLFEELEKEEPEHFAVRQYKKYKLAAGVVCSKRLLNQAVRKSLRTHNLKPKKGAQVMRKNEKITALYERLSRDDFGKDDDQQRESNSISNQKAMLEEFAARQGFTNIVHFTDDGISGTCFDRPGFLAMMKEVEAGNVEYLCISLTHRTAIILSQTSLSARPSPSDTTADFARRIWKCTVRYCSMSWYYPTSSLSIAPRLTKRHEAAWN